MMSASSLDQPVTFTLLSYPLGPHTPTYGDNPPVTFTVESSVAAGDVANWLSFTTVNHNGTHLDAPYHFNPHGKRVTDLDVNELVFERPAVLDIGKGDGELIGEADLRAHAPSLGRADLVLVRTGWARRWREADPARFGRRAPGFSADAGHYLRAAHPQVRALGMDLPSAASPVAGRPNEEGLEFHRVVLGQRASDPYVLLIEDMKLAQLDARRLVRVLVVPLGLEGADAAPVTVLAEVTAAPVTQLAHATGPAVET